MHKYLNRINQHPYFYNVSKCFKHNKEKFEHGFDSREIWNLDYAFYCWLYERVMFKLKDFDDNRYSSSKVLYWNGKQYSERDLLNEMAIRLRYYFKTRDEYLFLSDEDKKYIEEIGKMWCIILHSMW